MWVNYNDLTATSLEIMVSIWEIIPFMAELFRLVKYYNLPRYIIIYHLVICYMAMENPNHKWRFRSLGKSSISMDGLFHGLSISISWTIHQFLLAETTIFCHCNPNHI